MKTLARFLWCTWLQQQLTSHLHYTAMFILQLSLMTTLLYKRSRVVKVHEINIPGGVKKLLAERYWKAYGKRKKKKKVHFFCLVGGKIEDNKENTKIILFMKRVEMCMWNTGFTVIVFAFLYFQINQHLGGIWVWVSFFFLPQPLLKKDRIKTSFTD